MQQDLLQMHNGDIQLQEAWLAKVLFEIVKSGGKKMLKLGEHDAHLSKSFCMV